MVLQMIEGCGELVEGSDFCCGDSIETGRFEGDQELVQPIYCPACWKKMEKKHET